MDQCVAWNYHFTHPTFISESSWAPGCGDADSGFGFPLHFRHISETHHYHSASVIKRSVISLLSQGQSLLSFRGQRTPNNLLNVSFTDNLETVQYLPTLPTSSNFPLGNNSPSQQRHCCGFSTGCSPLYSRGHFTCNWLLLNQRARRLLQEPPAKPEEFCGKI